MLLYFFVLFEKVIEILFLDLRFRSFKYLRVNIFLERKESFLNNFPFPIQEYKEFNFKNNKYTTSKNKKKGYDFHIFV